MERLRWTLPPRPSPSHARRDHRHARPCAGAPARLSCCCCSCCWPRRSGARRGRAREQPPKPPSAPATPRRAWPSILQRSRPRCRAACGRWPRCSARRQAELNQSLGQRLDAMTGRIGQTMTEQTKSTHENLAKLQERLAVIDTRAEQHPVARRAGGAAAGDPRPTSRRAAPSASRAWRRSSPTACRRAPTNSRRRCRTATGRTA